MCVNWRAGGDVLSKMRSEAMFWANELHVCLTKDLRYDSNDSREIEKGSFSLSMLR